MGGKIVPAKIHIASSDMGIPKPAAMKQRKYAIGGVVDRTLVMDSSTAVADDAWNVDRENTDMVCVMDESSDGCADICRRVVDSVYLYLLVRCACID